MKIWLDDTRTPLDSSWVWVKSAQAIIDMLSNPELDIEQISLDHDLGDEELYGNGYQVLLYIEERVFTDKDYAPPRVFIHTANPVAMQKMKSALTTIYKKRENNAQKST